ncbi:adenylyl-sulfate kinase [Ekhidna sp. To15]|uniref:adenylyl-sulfate kinase n=1 Tax=Ekhidna sp. To15 TaxID=3395267 RepID=UPI003F523D30
MEDYKENIIPHAHSVNLEDRVKKNGFRPKLLWFTGLSGSGKSTLASALEAHFHNQDFNTYILDGDNIRSGLNNDLDFSEESRKENIRRISEVSRLFVDAGVIVLTAFISPFKEDREAAKKLVGEEYFLEIHVDCPLEVCEQRDVKGLYKKARAGEIKYFTGITSPFEAPENPDIRVNTAKNSLEDCLKLLIEEIQPKIRL